MPERFQLPPVITASTWPNVAESIWSQSKRGRAATEEGVPAPIWTNREAVALAAALREVARGTPTGAPWWYQLAAIAYGWAPERDELTATSTQADAPYPAEAAAVLASEIVRVTNELDASHRPEPRIWLADVFDRTDFKYEVMQALHEDGAKAQFKIPLPACKGPDGRPTRPVWDRTTRKWRCPDGVVVVDDPLTALLRSLIRPAVVVGVIYLIATGVPVAVARRRKRQRK